MDTSMASSRRGVSMALSLMIATVALAVVALPVSGATWSATKKLAGPGTYWTIGAAAENNNIAVSWLENASKLAYRVSTDKGNTFGPQVTVGPSYTPAAVTLCGGFVAAVRGVGGDIVLDLRSIDGSLSTSRNLATGRNLTATGNGIACVGGRRLATFWDEYVAGVLRLKVAVIPVVEPLAAYEFDLGAAKLYTVRGIATTETGIWVAWPIKGHVMIQRLDVGTGAQAKVAKATRTQLTPPCPNSGVGVAAAGDRVYVAYDCPDDVYMRISSDRGRTFHKQRVIFQAPGSEPVSVWGMAARENVVVASVHVGPWCIGCVGSNRAIYSADWGRVWTAGPTNTGGYMPGVALLGSGSAMRIVQAWDNRTSHETYGDPGYIKLRMGKP